MSALACPASGSRAAVSRCRLLPLSSCIIAVVLSACGDMPTQIDPQPTRAEVAGEGSNTGSSVALSTMRLFVEPISNARRQAELWRATRPVDAAQMDKIAAQPQSRWFGDWNSDVRAAVEEYVASATRAGRLPVLVAYNIPQRDCGGYSAGGVNSASAYRSWISAFANGVGNRRAVVILEPDALPALDCLSSTDRQTRLSLLRHAVHTLKAKGGIYVYLDAGHPRWQSAATMADRLSRAGVQTADGFSLNVSNFITTAENIAYGKSISERIGGKRFVIDTSRNGQGPAPDLQWCNPPGRGLGQRPTTRTGHALVDAYLWIKAPGESDGACNLAPQAGVWWPEYALQLARRAPY